MLTMTHETVIDLMLNITILSVDSVLQFDADRERARRTAQFPRDPVQQSTPAVHARGTTPSKSLPKKPNP